MSEFTFPLVSADTLNYLLEKDDIFILDASIPPIGTNITPQYSWPDTVIGKAKRFDIEGDFSDHQAQFPHTMISPEKFERLCQQLGINKNHQIVIYDDLGLFSAARAWWMFKSMGHEKVAVLNGGLPNWLKRGLPTDRAENNSSDTGNFSSNFLPAYFSDYRQVLSSIESQNSLILDARAQARFFGEAPEPRAGVRSGHMPSAENLPYSTLLKDGLLLPKEELTKIFQQINPQNKPLVMSCGSGITACILALAATIAGQREVKVYDGSWAEWGSLPEYPVVTN